MAVNKVDFPTGGAPTSTDDYVDTLSNLAGALTGKGYIPITNFGTTSTPQIAQSALFVAGGVLYQADADTAISGSIAAERYIEMVPSGSPTGATLTPTWTATAPTWKESYNHYVSAADNLVLHVMRDEDTYNTFIDIQHYKDIADGTSTQEDSLLGELARFLSIRFPKMTFGTIIEGDNGTTLTNVVDIIHVGANTVNSVDANVFLLFDATAETVYDYYIAIGDINALGNNLDLSADSGTSRRLAKYDEPTGTTVEVVYSSIESIRMLTYTYDTSTVQTGSTFTTTETSGHVDVCVLPTTKYIIRYEDENETLQAYSWNGSVFSLITSTSVTGTGWGALEAVDSTQFLLTSGSSDLANVRAYSFNGSTFTLIDTVAYNGSSNNGQVLKIDDNYYFGLMGQCGIIFLYNQSTLSIDQYIDVSLTNLLGLSFCIYNKSAVITFNGNDYSTGCLTSRIDGMGII